MKRALAFLSPGPLAYGSRLARLRWARAAGADRVADWQESDSARAAVEGADAWTLVRDAAALPLSPAAGQVSHTLREFETAPRGAPQAGPPLAVAFRVSELPPERVETVERYVRRLLASSASQGLAAFVIGEASERERPEVTSRLPAGPARILDAGCGAGGLGLARARKRRWHVTGIERDPRLAARARDLLDTVIEGDLADVLPRLSAGGARFDAVVFADVLEHLEDPVSALALGRRLASPDGVLVASVPNVGHISVVRDLLLGRHDPVPAGLCDAGHLRWFTRSSFEETIAEAGWSLQSLDGERGAPAPNPEPFLELVAQWPDADRESLGTYQWIARARAG